MKKNKKRENKPSIPEQELQTDINVLKYAKKVTKRKYLRELEIESGIIEQSAHMQAAFSFITAVVFMVAPIACEYRGPNISLNYIFLMFVLITIPIVLSLLFATLAHDRIKHDEEEDGEALYQYILQNEDWFKNEKGQLDYEIQLNIILQKSITETNESRLNYLRASSKCFYIGIGVSLICFVIYLLAM